MILSIRNTSLATKIGRRTWRRRQSRRPRKRRRKPRRARGRKKPPRRRRRKSQRRSRPRRPRRGPLRGRPRPRSQHLRRLRLPRPRTPRPRPWAATTRPRAAVARTVARKARLQRPARRGAGLRIWHSACTDLRAAARGPRRLGAGDLAPGDLAPETTPRIYGRPPARRVQERIHRQPRGEARRLVPAAPAGPRERHHAVLNPATATRIASLWPAE